jgi:hypothetical protein
VEFAALFLTEKSWASGPSKGMKNGIDLGFVSGHGL